jgi:hypothetical protein
MVKDRPDDNGSPRDPTRNDAGPPVNDTASDDVARDAAAPQADLSDDAPRSAEFNAEPRVDSAGDSPVFSTGAEPAPRASLASKVLLPGISGALAAAAVVAALSNFGAGSAPPPAPGPVVVSHPDKAAFDALSARIASLESKPAVAAPAPATDAAADQALNGRIDGLEKSVAALRGELAEARGQSEPLTAAPAAAPPAVAANNPQIDPGRVEALEKSLAALRDDVAAARSQTEQLSSAVKAEPAEPPPSPELAVIKERLVQVERAAKARQPETPRTVATDDKPLRRVVTAMLLDISVRQSQPFAATLEAAKPLASDPAALQSLDGFANAGVPSAIALSRELLDLLPKLSSQDVVPGAGVVDRLQAGAERLVRIQRGDTPAAGTDRSTIIARAAAAARRNDIAEARRELNALSAADRAPVASWIDKVDARDAALAASQQFAAAALSALPKSSP